MIGTITESELGGPIQSSPFGPNQPSAPMIQVSEKIRPVSVINRSDRVRRKSRISAAINSRASPINGPIPDSVASLYSSSIMIGETLLTRSGPSESSARSFTARSASAMRSSPVSRRRMVETVTEVPSVSSPDIAANAPASSGTALIASISA